MCRVQTHDVGLGAGHLAGRRHGVTVDADEEVGLGAVRDGGALVEWHEHITVARVDEF